MSKIEVNTIDTQCGSALQIGDGNTATIGLGKSGDTITIPSGATIVNSGTQTGFGRTGTVDWDTSIHTGTVTAATGKGYFVNTTSGGITVNLPAAAVGSIVAVSDYASTADSNNITVSPNGSEKINGINDDYTISTKGLAVTLVYADATKGWKSVTGSDADATGVVPLFVTATGGTPCTGAICGNFKTHVFTGPGTFVVSCAGGPSGSNTVDYLVSAGGGGGGGYGAGGGGAGGFRLSNSVGCIAAPVMSPLASPTGITVAATPYAIVVGGGGPAGCGSSPGPGCGTNGSTSSFSTITSSGGGFGRGYQAAGNAGGSGGGGRGGPSPTSGYPGGAGNTPPFSPAQGTAGGAGYDGLTASTNGGGGGGGAVAGGNGAAYTGGTGGAGGYLSNTFFGPLSPSYGTPGPVGSTKYFSGGGGGGTDAAPPVACQSSGGAGGGGTGGQQFNVATAGTCNTGGGGGGSGTAAPGGGGAGGNGGSGIVIIRYKFQ